MESADLNPPLKYTVHPDLKVYERYLRRDGKDRLREWIYHALRQIPNYGFLCAGGYAFGQLVGGTTSWPGIVAAMSMGVIIGPVSTFMDFDGSVHRVLADLKGKSWDCTLIDSCWQCTDNDGVTTSFPWELMRIEKSDPDYWEISCRNSTVVVFRQPLREAGFEEEFERRLGGG
jgi:hypothetical protein